MSVINFANAVQRRLETMFSGYFNGSTKHCHYLDFGWPEELTFDHFYRMFQRNSVAKAGVVKTITKTWETDPQFWETEESQKTPLEKKVKERFTRIRLWQKLAIADKRSMVGRYSAILLRYADNQNWDQPVGRVPGGLNGLVEVIPVWEKQLTVSMWNQDPRDENFGKPSLYQFNESAVPVDGFQRQNQPRTFNIHPDRVIIWSDDGTMDCESALEAGYNDLIDIEKIKGAGGEGFWKNSRGAPVISAPEGMSQTDVAKAMGVTNSEMVDAINEQIESFQQGFDKGLLLGGLTAEPMNISLPNPEQFFVAPVQSFAASLEIPLKVLMGSQTGERSSTEDAKEWNKTVTSRRNTRIMPLLRELIDRLEKAGVLSQRDWIIQWESLIDASVDEKVKRAETLSKINKDSMQPPFTWEEIREAAGYDPDVSEPGLENGPTSRTPAEDDITEDEQNA